MLSWAWMLSRREFPVWHCWAWGIFAGSVLYTAFADVMIRRTRRLRAVAAATTLCDSATVTLICLVTGGLHSDFYPYYYITVLAGSVRFGPRETFFALVLNTFCSALVFVAAPGRSYPAGDLLLEIYYMLFIALMSSWLSRLAKEHYRRAARPEVNVMLFRVLQEAVLNVRNTQRRAGSPSNGSRSRVARRASRSAMTGGVSIRMRFRAVTTDCCTMKERAEACGGKLDARSRPNQGIEVRVTVADARAA
jgi:hypothetical protein